jgi:MFS family permease
VRRFFNRKNITNRRYTEEELVRHSLNISIYEGIGAVIYALVIQGVFFTKIALEFGADAFTLSLLLGIQYLSQVFQLFVPALVTRLGKRKPFVLIFVLISRCLWLSVLVLAIFGYTQREYFVLIVSLGFICSAVVGNAWTSWMKDLVPQKRMGRFFGFRNLVHSFCSLVFTWIYSSILNHWPNRFGIELILAIAVTAGFISVLILSKQHEPPIKEVRSVSFLKLFRANKDYRALLVFGGCWNFTILFAASFFSYHQLENLKVNFALLGYLSMLTSSVTMVFYWLWGRIADKIGHKNILRIGISIACFTAIMWFIMTPETMHTLLWVDAITSALAWSAINLAIFTLPMLVGGESAIVLVAFFGAVNGLFGFAGSLVGGILSTWLVPLTFTMGNLTMQGIQFLFLGSGILRIFCLLLLNKVSVVGHIRLRTVMFEVITNITRRGAKEIVEPAIAPGIEGSTEGIKTDINRMRGADEKLSERIMVRNEET